MWHECQLSYEYQVCYEFECHVPYKLLIAFVSRNS